jgi:hypothetical protein
METDCAQAVLPDVRVRSKRLQDGVVAVSDAVAVLVLPSA